MMLYIVVVFSLCLQLSNALRFDCYTGKIASQALVAYYKSRGILDVCTTEIEACCATERRRVDGSCNCLRSPSKGTFFKPLTRVLPAHYYNGSYSRKACSGKELLWPRTIRRILLAEGDTSDCNFTQALTSYGIFMFLDIASIHDISQFVFVKTDCCTKKGKKEYACTPNFVSKDDTLNRLADIKCLNLTRPLTFQFFGCTKDSVPAPIVHATSAFDLSQIYNFENKGDKVIRAYRRGLLKMEKENGKIWPPNGPSAQCPLNKPDETRCFKNYPNILLIQTLFVVWFTRFHNYCATQLARVNPCWDDETLFQVARDICISVSMQIYLYEWSKSIQGHDYLVKSGVISEHPGFRNIYDRTLCPSNSLEYTFIMRYFHTAQKSKAKLYDKHGRHVKDESIFTHTTNTGFLAKDKNMEQFTQGQFRQSCGKINDCTIDNDVADNGLPKLQECVDITASDLHKSRLFGLRSYCDYLHYCTGHKITCFDDLRGHVDECKIQELKKCYEDVCDIDLMAGMWVEKHVPGGFVPRTFACLFNANMLNAIKSDRHWYENEHRPYAYNLKQLLEIRKASLAMLLCKVGDDVTKIQPNAFVQISHKNPLKKCSEIPSIDFKAWADPKCSSKTKGYSRGSSSDSLSDFFSSDSSSSSFEED